VKGASGTFNLTSFDQLPELLSKGKKITEESRRPVLVSTTERVKLDVDPVLLFAAATHLHDECYYWGVPLNGSWIVGAGTEAEIVVDGPDRFKRAKTVLREILNTAILDEGNKTCPIFIGGFRFDAMSHASDNWAGFPDGLLSLPRIVISCEPPDLVITVNVFVKSEMNIESVQTESVNMLKALFEQSPSEHVKNTSDVIEETPREEWKQSVHQALEAMNGKRIRKVALARMAKARSQSPIVPEDVLRSLINNYPMCRVFAICHSGNCFIGASPEELVSLHGSTVTSTCLAGSAPRGISEYEDSHFSEGLMESAKEREEHEIVVDWVSEHLRDLCQELQWNKTPEVLRLGNVQHLATRFMGTSKTDATILDFVGALHPTPAVGGFPLEPSLELIRRAETFDRGWYAGPVGWVNGNGLGEFAIALRCALIREKNAFLYAGAGIVSASDADREYEETTLKLKPLLTALGVR